MIRTASKRLWLKLPMFMRYSLECAAAWACIGLVAGIIAGFAAASDPVLHYTPWYQDILMTLAISLVLTFTLGLIGGLTIWCTDPWDRFLYRLHNKPRK